MTAQATTNLVLRNDTILGVCEAIGQDFGFNPNWLRIAFCVPIYLNPVAVIGAYLALGVMVAATRYAFPDVSANPKAELLLNAVFPTRPSWVMPILPPG